MHKILFLLFIVCALSCIQSYPLYATGQMPSKNEDLASRRLARRWARALSLSSPAYCRESIDSLKSFLVQYPNSLYKFMALAYEFDLVLATSNDSIEIGKVADDLLQVDSTSLNQNWVGQRLVSHSVCSDRGKALVEKSLPFLQTDGTRYSSHEVLARYHMNKGDFVAARAELDQAIAIDSTQFETWIDYMALARFTEDSHLGTRIQTKLTNMKDGELKAFKESSTLSKNLFKQFYASDFLDLHRDTLRSSFTANKVTVLNYFSFYCESCVPEMAEINKLSKKYSKAAFFYINIDPDSEAATFPYMKKPALRFLQNATILMEGPRVQKQLHLEGVPQVLLLDQSGIVRYDHLGYIKGAEKELEKNLIALLRK